MMNKCIETDLSLFFERFPHLRDRIELLWGTPEGSKAINDLILDSRQGTRGGFPKEYLDTLITLCSEHETKFPEFTVEMSGFELDKETVGRKTRNVF